MKKLLRKIILWALEEKNTTAANSDVSNLQVYSTVLVQSRDALSIHVYE